MKLLHLCAVGFTVKNLLLPKIDYFRDLAFVSLPKAWLDIQIFAPLIRLCNLLHNLKPRPQKLAHVLRQENPIEEDAYQTKRTFKLKAILDEGDAIPRRKIMIVGECTKGPPQHLVLEEIRGFAYGNLASQLLSEA